MKTKWVYEELLLDYKQDGGYRQEDYIQVIPAADVRAVLEALRDECENGEPTAFKLLMIKRINKALGRQDITDAILLQKRWQALGPG